MASYPNDGYGNGNGDSDGDGDGDDTDRNLNRRMKKMGKSKPIYKTETETAKFDADGVLIEASAEREVANRRARITRRSDTSPRPGPTKPGVGVAVEATLTTTGKINTAEAPAEAVEGTRVTLIEMRTETVKNLT
jgi:hypothetical protein